MGTIADAPYAGQLARRLLQLGACATAALVLSGGPRAAAWELEGTRIDVVLDNPNSDGPWRRGDVNCNFAIDGVEQTGQLTQLDRPFGTLSTRTDPFLSPSTKKSGTIVEYRNAAFISYGVGPYLSDDFSKRRYQYGSYFSWRNVQISRSLRFVSDSHPTSTGKASQGLTLNYGARFVESQYDFAFSDDQELSSVDIGLRTGNSYVGPHLGAEWNRELGRLRADFSLLGMLGYRFSELSRTVTLLADAPPSAVNQPFDPTPTTYRSAASNGRYTPLAEATARITFNYSPNVAMYVAATNLWQSHVFAAEDVVGATLFAETIPTDRDRDFTFTSLMAGFEWRR